MSGAMSLTDGERDGLWLEGYSAGRTWRVIGGDRLTRADLETHDFSRDVLSIRLRAIACGATWWEAGAAEPHPSVAGEVWAIVRAGFARALADQDWIKP